MPASMINAKKLADEHWSYIESLLQTHCEDSDVIKKIKFHYKSAFIHGYKHAMEDENNKITNFDSDINKLN